MTDYNDGKIHGWNGGDCPVHRASNVRVWLRDGDQDNDLAVSHTWSHDDGCCDIIAFQVTKQFIEPKTIWLMRQGGKMIYSTELERQASYVAAIAPEKRTVEKYQQVAL